MVKFENREIWADLENRSKVVHSENFPIWRPASGDRDHVTHHVTSHVTHWGQWKYASRSWHAVGNHRRQLKLMYRSKISGRGPKHCSGSKFQCRPRPDNLMIKFSSTWQWTNTQYGMLCWGGYVSTCTRVRFDRARYVLVRGRLDAGTFWPGTQWETSLQSNVVSHWLRANLESGLTALPPAAWPQMSLSAFEWGSVRSGGAVWGPAKNCVLVGLVGPAVPWCVVGDPWSARCRQGVLESLRLVGAIKLFFNHCSTLGT